MARHWDNSSSQVPGAEVVPDAAEVVPDAEVATDVKAVTAAAPLANRPNSPTLARMALDGRTAGMSDWVST